jgi:hypothetical protein
MHQEVRIGSVYYLWSAFATIIFSYLIYILADGPQRAILGHEDGIYENLGALFFLLSSILFFITYFKSQPKKNIFFLLLGILLLVAFLEEISWGQRIFNIDTPELFQEMNMQHEINLHNLTIFHGREVDGSIKHGWKTMITAGRIFSLFWFMWCVVLPILYLKSNKIKEISDKIKVPIVPISIGLLFMFTYAIGKILFFTLENAYKLEEIKECNIAFLFFIVSLWFYFNPTKSKDK